MDKIEKEKELEESNRRIKQSAKWRYSLQHLDSLRNSLESSLSGEEYEEICDNVATLQAYIYKAAKRNHFVINR